MNLHPQNYGLTLGVVPMGDWTYSQEWGDQQLQKISGSSWEDLIEQVRIFRLNQNIPIGDPAAEVSEAIRKRSPQNDIWRTGKAEFTRNNHVPLTPLIEKMREYFGKLKNKQVALESEDVAEKRAEVCLGCPQNINYQSSCHGCDERVRYDGILIRRRAEFRLDSRLKGCRLHGFLLSTAVFLTDEDLPPRHPDSPPGCFVKPKE